MPRIKCQNATLDIPIFDVRSLRASTMDTLTGGRVVKGRASSIIRAVENFNMEFNDGDAVGIYGHNGSGKTTLLRLLSGIYSPTEGSIVIEGDAFPIIELGVGIEEELTGAENIRRLLLLQSGSTKPCEHLVQQISEFSDLGTFLQLPVRTYSSGMVMRLVFSTFIFMQPEIFLLDEFFSTNDKAFTKKVENKIQEAVTKSGIFIFASHQVDLLASYCSRFIYMKHGQGIEISREELLSLD